MSFLFEFDHLQAAFLTRLMDKADHSGLIPAGEAGVWAGIRAQLAQPTDAKEAVARIKAQGAQEAQQAAPVIPIGLPSTPAPSAAAGA